jgi:DNA polymerase III epsilon subunit family exonuclease
VDISDNDLKNLIHKRVSFEKASEIVNILDKKWCNCAFEEFVALDIETTGLYKGCEYILEVAAIRYRECEEVEKFVSLINPLVRIPYYVSQIHGITNKTVENSPTIDVVLPKLLEFIGSNIIVAHNASFDIGFIEVWARRLGYNPYWNYIDTVSVAKKVIPGLQNYKQPTILNAIGYAQNVYHRAEDDVRGCVEIIKYALGKIR